MASHHLYGKVIGAIIAGFILSGTSYVRLPLITTFSVIIGAMIGSKLGNNSVFAKIAGSILGFIVWGIVKGIRALS